MPVKIVSEPTTDKPCFKVRVSRTYAAYYLVEADSAEDARKMAKKMLFKDYFDIVEEAAYGHYSIEVEDT